MSTLLILTFSISEVGSILDFVHSGFCPFWILSNPRFCPIRDFVQFGILLFGILPVLDFVQLEIFYVRDFVQFGIWFVLDFVQFGILSILDFVQFGILSILDFVQFGILSVRNFVFRDFVQNPYKSLLSECKF